MGRHKSQSPVNFLPDIKSHSPEALSIPPRKLLPNMAPLLQKASRKSVDDTRSQVETALLERSPYFDQKALLDKSIMLMSKG